MGVRHCLLPNLHPAASHLHANEQQGSPQVRERRPGGAETPRHEGSPSMMLHRAPATLRLTTPPKLWGPGGQTIPWPLVPVGLGTVTSGPLAHWGSSSSPAKAAPMLPGRVPGLHDCVPSVVHGPRGPALPTIPRSSLGAGPRLAPDLARGRECPLQPSFGFPGLGTASSLAFLQSCRSRSALGLAEGAGQFFSQPESRATTSPSPAPPPAPADWTGGRDVTRLRVSGD